MSLNPYTPPSAAVRDAAPDGPGPLHDALAVVAGVALLEFLLVMVAEEIVWTVVFALGVSPDDEEMTALTLDLMLSFAFTLFAYWAAWRLSRSRRLRVPAIVGGVCLGYTFVNRWLLEDFGWPLWYEASLLALFPLAAAAMWYAIRRHRRI